jgi:CheY-like chemotaxis protein
MVQPTTILLFEDMLGDEELAMRAFKRCDLPLTVRVARDGAKALELVKTIPEWTDQEQQLGLIISDLKMPRLHGDEVLSAVRHEPYIKSVPYVIFSSTVNKDELDHCRALGADECYIKPVDPREFTDCIRAMVERWVMKPDRGPFAIQLMPFSIARASSRCVWK